MVTLNVLLILLSFVGSLKKGTKLENLSNPEIGMIVLSGDGTVGYC
ncbi:MAG: hypothetical protein ABIN61_03550 [candidate division WOR-3 bacterium]